MTTGSEEIGIDVLAVQVELASGTWRISVLLNPLASNLSDSGPPSPDAMIMIVESWISEAVLV